MDMHDYVSEGGLYRTELGYTANVTQILIKSGNTYPLVGIVTLSPGYIINVAWTANGTVTFPTANNIGMNLAPIILVCSRTSGNALTLSSESNVATWQANNYIYY